MPDQVGHDEICKSKMTKKKFHVEQLAAEVDEEDGDVGGGDARDAGGLGDGGGAIALEFLAAFDGETLDFVEIKVSRNLDILQAIVLFGLLLFALDIARVLDANLD